MSPGTMYMQLMLNNAKWAFPCCNISMNRNEKKRVRAFLNNCFDKRKNQVFERKIGGEFQSPGYRIIVTFNVILILTFPC